MNNVAILNNEEKKQLGPVAWVKNLFEIYKQNQDELMRKKIDFLYKNTYKFYLDLYLTGVEQKNLVDIPAYLYRKGYTKSMIATQYAMQAMIEVIKSGRINECYTNLVEYLKAQKKLEEIWKK